MKYPRVNNYLTFKKITPDEYEVTNYLTDEKWILCTEYLQFLCSLDGHTDPYEWEGTFTRQDIDELLCELREEEMLQPRKRVLTGGIGNMAITLGVPKCGKRVRAVATVFNYALLSFWAAVLLSGIILRYFGDKSTGFRGGNSWYGLLLGGVPGMILHEAAHACAALSYGAKVFEFGIMSMRFMPGAYVSLEENKVKDCMKRIQIYAAGVEMNFLLAGVFLIASVISKAHSYTFLSAAAVNIVLGLFNLSLVDGLDGMHILSEVMGIDCLMNRAKEIIKSKRKKQRLRKSGVNGHAVILASYILLIFQIAFPLGILINVFIWFV